MEKYSLPLQLMTIEPIAYFRSPMTSKFGIPRQSGIVEGLRGRIEFVGRYVHAEALHGLDDYDYLWLIWGFSENIGAEKHATVRPPLLGGNKRMGVWATRSPYRPNNLGLSAVRIAHIDYHACAIDVLGADLMDGTPVYDVKPYLPYADSYPEARGGITDQHQWHHLSVVVDEHVAHQLEPVDLRVLTEVLALDPRPHYQDDPEREYGLPFMGRDVRFRVSNGVLHVLRWDKL